MSAGDHETEAPTSKKMEEGTKETSPERRKRIQEVVNRHWSLGLRVAELVLAILCIGLIVDALHFSKGFTSDPLSHAAVVYSTFSGYIVILTILVFGRMMGEYIEWRTSLAFSVVGAILFTASGGIILSDWSKMMYAHAYARPQRNYLDMMCASGVFAILNAATFLLNAYLTYRKERIQEE